MNEKTNGKLNVKKLSECSVLAAIALIFSYVEFLVPISIGIPGIKLGLANTVIVIALYTLDAKSAFVINVVRIALAALLFGSVYSALYSLAGGVLSFAVMYLLKKSNLFSTIGVSMAGGVVHNFGQLLVSALALKTPKILSYFPVLTISGIITGIFIGIVAVLVIRRVGKKA